MQFIKSHKRIAAGTATLFIVAAVAIAQWLISASGPGGGRIGQLTAPTVSAGAAASGFLYPNSDGALTFNVDNPNGSLVVTGAAQDPVNGDSISGVPSACSAVLTVQSVTGLSVSVPAGSSTVTVPGVIHAGDLPSSCQGQSFTARAQLNFATP